MVQYGISDLCLQQKCLLQQECVHSEKNDPVSGILIWGHTESKIRVIDFLMLDFLHSVWY